MSHVSDASILPFTALSFPIQRSATRSTAFSGAAQSAFPGSESDVFLRSTQAWSCSISLWSPTGTRKDKMMPVNILIIVKPDRSVLFSFYKWTEFTKCKWVSILLGRLSKPLKKQLLWSRRSNFPFSNRDNQITSSWQKAVRNTWDRSCTGFLLSATLNHCFK